MSNNSYYCSKMELNITHAYFLFGNRILPYFQGIYFLSLFHFLLYRGSQSYKMITSNVVKTGWWGDWSMVMHASICVARGVLNTSGNETKSPSPTISGSPTESSTESQAKAQAQSTSPACPLKTMVISSQRYWLTFLKSDYQKHYTIILQICNHHPCPIVLCSIMFGCLSPRLH